MSWFDAISLVVLGALVGAYGAWALTVWWFDHHGGDFDEDGGIMFIPVPDFVPDDLVGR